jgi:hypothetical protein
LISADENLEITQHMTEHKKHQHDACDGHEGLRSDGRLQETRETHLFSGLRVRVATVAEGFNCQ